MQLFLEGGGPFDDALVIYERLFGALLPPFISILLTTPDQSRSLTYSIADGIALDFPFSPFVGCLDGLFFT